MARSHLSTASPKLRWGILSTARINRALLRPLGESPRSYVAAVASRRLDTAQLYARQNDIPKAYGSYRDLLSDPDIDAVYVSLPNSLHCEWTVAAAESGKHVLCEKPLVLTLDEMDRVQKAAEDAGVTVFEAFMYLHHPQSLRLQELVRQQQIGQLERIRSWFSFLLPPGSTSTRLVPDLGGGSLWDVGVYPVSFSIVMAGAGTPVEVSASQTDGETGVDVGFAGQLRFANGVESQIACGFRRPREWGARLHGSRRSLAIDEPWKPGFEGTESTVEIREAGELVDRLDFGEPDPYRCEVAAMEACALEGAAPVVPLALSRDSLRTVLALYESAASGRPVALDRP